MKIVLFNQIEPVRLDIFLAKELNYTRSFITKLIKKKYVKINNQTVVKASLKLHYNDSIEILKFSNSKKNNFKINIIYQDDNILVIDKPYGLLVHAKDQFDQEFTLENWLNKKFPKLKNQRAGIVHRLDRLTSGVMIIGLNKLSIESLKKQFSLRQVEKTYYAVVDGLFNDNKILIDLQIKRSIKYPNKFMVDINGKSSQTLLIVKKMNIVNKTSLVELKPKTGRTHQLRVHLNYIKHPIVGDPLYNKKVNQNQRMMLHAYSIRINLLNGVSKVFKTKLPIEFNEYLE